MRRGRRNEIDPDKTQLEIERRRKELRPIEVERQIPSWVRKAVSEAIKKGDLPKPDHRLFSAGDSFEYATNQLGGSWADHAGRVKEHKDILVSEPYQLPPGAVAQLQRFCDVLNAQFSITPVAWHYPGRCIQILIAQPK